MKAAFFVSQHSLGILPLIYAQEPTIGAAFFTQILSLSEATVKFDVWDTAGQERYHSLAPMYYRGAAAAIVVYDISSVVSIRVVNFESIMVYLEWIHWNL